MSCLELFTAGGITPEEVDKNAPNCACEGCQVSPHNNNPVSHDEVLVRLIVDDSHIDRESGYITLMPTVFSDAEKFGASVLRLGKASREEYEATINLLTSSPRPKKDGTPKEVIGYVLVPVKQVKAIVFDEEVKKGEEKRSHGAFCIYATGMVDRPHHADIMCANFAVGSKSKRRRVCKELAEKVGGEFHLASVDEILELGV